MRYPAYLKTEDVSPAAVRRFARKLEVRQEQGNPVPVNLKAVLMEWLNQHVIDYAPIQKLERDLDRLIKLEADALQLRFWERRAVSNALLATFTRRRRQRLPFTMGWPKLVAVTDPKIGDWGIHYYLNSARIHADAILNGGVRGLRLGNLCPRIRRGTPMLAEKHSVSVGSFAQPRSQSRTAPAVRCGGCGSLLCSISPFRKGRF